MADAQAAVLRQSLHLIALHTFEGKTSDLPVGDLTATVAACSRSGIEVALLCRLINDFVHAICPDQPRMNDPSPATPGCFGAAAGCEAEAGGCYMYFHMDIIDLSLPWWEEYI